MNESYKIPTYYDKFKHQWYAYDKSGNQHYGDTPWDARESADIANQRIEKVDRNR